jgi:type I restriction enzyme M protein
VDIIPEVGPSANTRAVYQHVELQDTADGVVTPHALRGWQLPDRARHGAEQGDIFVSRVWQSIDKWFVAGENCSSMVVTNGFYRLRLKPGKAAYLVDLVGGLNTEAYRIQARSYCTGSGLAELPGDDLLEIVLPQITDADARATLQQVVNTLLAGRTTVADVVEALTNQCSIFTAQVQPRSTHWVQV